MISAPLFTSLLAYVENIVYDVIKQIRVVISTLLHSFLSFVMCSYWETWKTLSTDVIPLSIKWSFSIRQFLMNENISLLMPSSVVRSIKLVDNFLR